MAQRPRAQIRPNTAKLVPGHDGHGPADDGPMRSTKRRYPAGVMADGGVVVLVSWLVSMCSHCWPCPRYWVTWIWSCRCTWASWLWVSAMANDLPHGLACQNPTQVAGPASPRLTASLTATPTTIGSTADGAGRLYPILSCADA